MVFLLAFSATAVVNIGFAGVSSGLQAYMFIGTLWLMKELPAFYKVSRSEFSPYFSRSTLDLRLFLCAVLLSLLMPIWINGGLSVANPEFGYATQEKPLQFSMTHVTQTLYLIYGVLITILVAYKNSKPQECIRSIRIFLISAIFVSLWGFLQLICYHLDVPYPAAVFNSSATESAQGYLEELEDLQLKRISSVTTEPSMFAQCLLVAAVFIIVALTCRLPLISRAWDRTAAGLILVALLISTSSTAYLGLALVALLCVMVLWYRRIVRGKHILLFSTLVGLVTYALASSSASREMLDSQLFSKTETYSAMARLNSILLARDYFLNYPILGLGWGSVASHDLVFKLLANTGLLGFVTFAIVLGRPIVRLWPSKQTIDVKEPDQLRWAVGLFIALVTLVATNIGTGFAFAFGHFWFILGLAIAAASWPTAPQSTGSQLMSAQA